MNIFNMYKIWQKIKPSNQNEHKHGPQSTADLNSKSDRCVRLTALWFAGLVYQMHGRVCSYWLYSIKFLFLKMVVQREKVPHSRLGSGLSMQSIHVLHLSLTNTCTLG